MAGAEPAYQDQAAEQCSGFKDRSNDGVACCEKREFCQRSSQRGLHKRGKDGKRGIRVEGGQKTFAIKADPARLPPLRLGRWVNTISNDGSRQGSMVASIV